MDNNISIMPERGRNEQQIENNRVTDDLTVVEESKRNRELREVTPSFLYTLYL